MFFVDDLRSSRVGWEEQVGVSREASRSAEDLLVGIFRVSIRGRDLLILRNG